MNVYWFCGKFWYFAENSGKFAENSGMDTYDIIVGVMISLPTYDIIVFDMISWIFL